jgi:hypothetical protein
MGAKIAVVTRLDPLQGYDRVEVTDNVNVNPIPWDQDVRNVKMGTTIFNPVTPSDAKAVTVMSVDQGITSVRRIVVNVDAILISWVEDVIS